LDSKVLSYTSDMYSSASAIWNNAGGEIRINGGIRITEGRNFGEVLIAMPDKQRYRGSSGWGLGVGITSLLRKNLIVFEPP
jgi:hypothetical protein